ncbi:MAG TPA: hypothetical protein VMV04_11140 [Thermodesulfobacteriota bacterium]|nr:hypothetical protein [Thermodesulfobacteriota bacterium]
MANSKTIANDLINDPPFFNLVVFSILHFQHLYPIQPEIIIRKTTVARCPILAASVVNLAIRSSPKMPIPPQNKATVKNAVAASARINFVTDILVTPAARKIGVLNPRMCLPKRTTQAPLLLNFSSSFESFSGEINLPNLSCRTSILPYRLPTVKMKKSVTTRIGNTTRNVGNSLIVPWAIKNPLNKRTPSSGNGNPIPPRMRAKKIPTYGQLFIRLDISVFAGIPKL